MSASYVLDNLLTSLRELEHKDLENGVHVQIANAIRAQIPNDDALETIKVLESRLANVKTWVGDAFMSAREAKWKAESVEKAMAKALDFISE